MKKIFFLFHNNNTNFWTIVQFSLNIHIFFRQVVYNNKILIIVLKIMIYISNNIIIHQIWTGRITYISYFWLFSFHYRINNFRSIVMLYLKILPFFTQILYNDYILMIIWIIIRYFQNKHTVNTFRTCKHKHNLLLTN